MKDTRLPKDPEVEFKSEFINWIDYLGIIYSYYNMKTCKEKIQEHLSNHPINDIECTNITKFLCQIDSSFSPYDL
jgi:hypothetical protein